MKKVNSIIVFCISIFVTILCAITSADQSAYSEIAMDALGVKNIFLNSNRNARCAVGSLDCEEIPTFTGQDEVKKNYVTDNSAPIEFELIKVYKDNNGSGMAYQVREIYERNTPIGGKERLRKGPLVWMYDRGNNFSYKNYSKDGSYRSLDLFTSTNQIHIAQTLV